MSVETEMHGENEAIDLIHFANTIADATVASPLLLSIDQMRANGARLIVPGFSIPNGKRHCLLKNIPILVIYCFYILNYVTLKYKV